VQEENNNDYHQGVQYHLVPDTRDLLGARMLLTMTPEDGDKAQGEWQHDTDRK